ncbi:MAG TPA: hypothetical protein VGP47_05615, partial [Parachlamydiaceae bacterium]|nr:hypothetical protein [Parachlamydiaceae bacterium]
MNPASNKHILSNLDVSSLTPFSYSSENRKSPQNKVESEGEIFYQPKPVIIISNSDSISPRHILISDQMARAKIFEPPYLKTAEIPLDLVREGSNSISLQTKKNSPRIHNNIISPRKNLSEESSWGLS